MSLSSGETEKLVSVTFNCLVLHVRLDAVQALKELGALREARLYVGKHRSVAEVLLAQRVEQCSEEDGVGDLTLDDSGSQIVEHGGEDGLSEGHISTF